MLRCQCFQAMDNEELGGAQRVAFAPTDWKVSGSNLPQLTRKNFILGTICLYIISI